MPNIQKNDPLTPTLHFRYKEIRKPEILLNMYMPPELKLQQLWQDTSTGVQEWRDVPRVPYTASDTDL